jgi:hypothetical protein
MSVPRRKVDRSEEEIPTLVPVPPAASSSASSGPSYLRDDYDPEKLIALLRHFRDDPTEDPEQQWKEFLELARAIDEDRPPGMRHFDQILLGE